MSEQATEPQAPEASAGAFGKDKQFGLRITQAVAEHEPFLLLGGKIEDDTIETTYGDAEVAKLLIQKIDPDTGAPKGAPIRCTTVGSAIVEKVKALSPDELAAGPICQIEHVPAKRRNGKPALVMTWLRNLQDADDYSEFGIDAAQIDRVRDGARPESERLPKDF